VRVVGLIAEYNPFHNGHLHHLRESLRITGADASVAIMSGHFLQRGEPALLDKWARTEMALAAGVDLVIELPFPFACNSAPCFARGAVQSLDALGVVDALCFGSESGDLKSLERLADLLVERADEIAAATASHLRRGVSYPAARAAVIARLAPEWSPDLIASPNNILGIEYLRALQVTASPMRAYTLARLGAGYLSIDVSGPIASATGIRQQLCSGASVDPYMPPAALKILQRAFEKGEIFDQRRFFSSLQTLLLQEIETLDGIYQVEDGLAQRLVDAALTATTYAELTDAIKSRQWTLTRIQRLLCFVLLQVADDEMREFLRLGPMYLRLLGASGRGRQVLARARTKKSLPMIADPARGKAGLRRFYWDRPAVYHLAERMLDCDLRATRLYGLLQANCRKGHRNQDFFRKVRTS
jgi:predicted nucleotidyltransferase